MLRAFNVGFEKVQELSFTSRGFVRLNWTSFARLLVWRSLLWLPMTWRQRYLTHNYFRSITSLTWICHYIYCFVQSGEDFKVKDGNKHTHTYTHHTHTHTHTHTHRGTKHDIETMMPDRWFKKLHLKQNEVLPLRTLADWRLSLKANFLKKRMMLMIAVVLESMLLLLSWFIGLCYCYFFKAASHVQQMLLLKSLHGMCHSQ